MGRRHAAALAAAFALVAVGVPQAQAQPQPAADKVVRLIVAFPAGGPVDFVARTIAEPLARELGQAVIVDNKPGANGAIGAEAVARAAPDGTTLWLTSVGAIAVNPVLYEKLPYDVQRDFAPVSLVVNNDELLVVNAANPATSARDLVAAAKRKGAPSPFASTGVGSIPHLAMEQFTLATKGDFTHVPYKGAAPAITDLIGGHVDAFFGDIPGLLPSVKSGKLKAIGIAAPRRSPVLPDVPTLAEQGIPGVDTNNWYALYAPAKTPSETIAALNRAVRATLAQPAVRDRLVAAGADPVASSPQELAALARSDTEKWGRLIRANKIQPE